MTSVRVICACCILLALVIYSAGPIVDAMKTRSLGRGPHEPNKVYVVQRTDMHSTVYGGV